MNRVWHLNSGKTPRNKEAEVQAIFACHLPARHTYKVAQLRWDLRGWDFDIKWFCKSNEVPTGMPWEVAI